MLQENFSFCRYEKNFDASLLNVPYFIAHTPNEISLMCQSGQAPKGYVKKEDGWKGFCVDGVLDFGLVGILFEITKVLADEKIPVAAISTFDTDYFFCKEDLVDKAVQALKNAGFNMVPAKPIR